MTVNVTPKTINLDNDNANDATQVDQMFQDTYGNEATLASYINANVVLKTGPNTFTGIQTFPTKPIMSAGLNVGPLLDTTQAVIGDFWYDNTINAYFGLAQIANISGATNASPIVISTTTSHNLASGDKVEISGVLGNTAANGAWNVTVLNSTSFSLNTSTGNGAYTSGGIVSTYKQFASIRDIGAFPVGYHGTATPIYGSASTFTVAFIRERDTTDAINISKTSSTTVNMATNGLNGITKTLLTPTVSVNSGSPTVSFSVAPTDLQVGDVITTAGGQSQRLISGSGVTWTALANFGSAETGVAAYRGGGPAPNTYYYLYGITNGVTPGLIMSTRNVSAGDALTDLPAGYLWSVQLAFCVLTDGSGNILPFRIGAGWPRRPRIDYLVKIGTGNTDTRILSGGSATSYTAINASSFIPPISRMAVFAWDSNTTGVLRVRESGNTAHEIITAGGGGSTSTGTDVNCSVNNSQQLDYKVSNGNASLYVQGFIITEVA